MNTTTKLGGFALALVAVFGATYATGVLAGPIGAGAASHQPGGADHQPGSAEGRDADTEPRLPGGLLVSDRGYTLVPLTATKREFAFRVTGPDGHPVTKFDVAHDKRMHLIVVRRDLSGYRHVHPTMDKDGTWRVDSPLGDPGTYRAYADFTPAGGKPLALGVDVSVPGVFDPRPLPAPAATDTVDGYEVTIDGTLRPGRTSTITLSVAKDGQPVDDLQPYLGAYGHLVALRDGDLAYLHVHADDATEAGPTITFFAEAPSAGAYRLFLDFKHAGVVRTAEFTVQAAAGSADAPPASPDADDHGGHGDGGHDGHGDGHGD